MRLDLATAILAHGPSAVEFTIPLRPLRKVCFIAFTTTGDDEEPVRCWIDQSRYNLENNYKIELVPYDFPNHPKRSFYLSDLASLMHDCPNDFKMHLLDTV